MFKDNDPNSSDRRSTVTKEENAATIEALVHERKGYEERGLDDRVKEVDKQLAALGQEAKPPKARSQSRPAQRKPSSRR